MRGKAAGLWLLCAIGALLLALGAVRGEAAAPRELTIAVYSVPKEVYERKLIPAFLAQWKQKTGQDVRIRGSYGASGAQARAIIGGLEADVAALSVEGDLDQIVKAGLITHDWRTGARRGMVSASVVAIGVRRGNPKAIKTWEDLTKPGVQVLYPNPKTSGGAMWDIIAIYGAALQGGKTAPQAAELVARIQNNVKVMDKSGRESVTTFERGVGDAIVTYENELIPRVKSGRPYEIILPPQTVLVENPASVVDRHADKHHVRDVAEAFVAYLQTDDAQRAFAEYGFRSVTDTPPAGVFTIAQLGGWHVAAERLFGPHGVWTKTVESAGAP
ncbi:MAG TPA: sulfate ABC transporter substrate-binding protein [Nitrospirales bacterium]|nr:sulfate ABC transporter substrate-binding protein [Nitrospirales bacterium]